MIVKKESYRAIKSFQSSAMVWPPQDGAVALFDVKEVERMMQATARQGKALSYSEALAHLGYQFTRPKMRALCAVLGAVDELAAKRKQPELAVLVTRASDKLPGQGWWIDRHAYQGSWTGAEAEAYIRKLQQAAFRYWRKN